MENLKEYNIKFVGLKDGDHSYKYKIGKKFFDAFDSSEITKGDLSVEVNFNKSSSILVFNFSIKGFIDTECDLCLDPLKIEIGGEFRQLVKLTDEEVDSTDEEITFLPALEFEINIAPFIFEFIHLCLPAKKIHENGECNTDVQNVLDQYLLSEENEEEDEHEVDPRWEALKALKGKDK